MMKFKLKKLLIPIIITIPLVLTANPSFGFVSIKDFLGSVLEDMRQEYSNAEEKVQEKIRTTWASLAEDASVAIESSKGEMGTPDPDKSTQDLIRRLKNSRAIPETKSLAQLLERDLARASVSSTLGTQGQQNTTQKILSTIQISQEVQDLAEQAQGLDASQNILKVIAAQNAQMVSTISRFHADSLVARLDTAQSNLMLTQVAETLANSTTKEELKTTGQVSLTQELVLMSVLDPARNGTKFSYLLRQAGGAGGDK
jgi:polyhydroxyalkanoate synthesis regulator phasin